MFHHDLQGMMEPAGTQLYHVAVSIPQRQDTRSQSPLEPQYSVTSETVNQELKNEYTHKRINK